MGDKKLSSNWLTETRLLFLASNGKIPLKNKKTPIVYKKTEESYIEWQRGTTNHNEWQRMVTSGTTNDNEW